MTKTLKDFMEVYKPKSPDEQKFVDKHVTIKHSDRNGNGDDVFKATNIKTIKRKEDRKGYDPGDDEKVYEALKGDQHKIDANKNGKVDAHDFHLLRKKKKVAEEVDEIDERFGDGDERFERRPEPKPAEKQPKTRLGQFLQKRKEKAAKANIDKLASDYAERQRTYRTHRESVEDVEEARVWHGDYNATSEISQFGGHRPKVVHKEKGHTMYLGQHGYKKPEMARKHAEAYLTAYSNVGPRAAENASLDFARANKKHMYKEDVDIEKVLDEALDLLMSIDEKTLTPAEMKKREEVVKAIKRDDPKMDKSMAYAIATKTAKRVAEGTMPTADEPTDADKKTAQKVRELLAKEKKPVKEDIEEIDELSKSTMGRYINRAKDQIDAASYRQGHRDSRGAGGDPVGKKIERKLSKRHGGIELAVNKLTKEGAEEIDELSRATLGSYAKKAMKDAPEKDRMGKAYSDMAADDAKRGEREGASYYGKRAAQTYTKAANRRAGVEKAIDKMAKEELELEESAKVAAHLIKRYGDNVRKSHVRSAANDFGVGYVALSHAVRKKLGVNRLEEEQIDEISAKKLTDYTAKASDARGYRDMPAAKLDKRYKSMALAHEKIRQRHAKVGATNEEAEKLDELSKKTLGNYTYKAASELGSKGITTGLKIAADEPTEKNFKKLANRQKGVASAVKRLTKEDIINRSVEKYVPEELKFTPEERLLKRLDGLSEAHVGTLLSLFEALNKDNQNKMIETVETREGINQLLNFALENRGE